MDYSTPALKELKNKLRPQQLMMSDRYYLEAGRGFGRTHTLIEHMIALCKDQDNFHAVMMIPETASDYLYKDRMHDHGLTVRPGHHLVKFDNGSTSQMIISGKDFNGRGCKADFLAIDLVGMFKYDIFDVLDYIKCPIFACGVPGDHKLVSDSFTKLIVADRFKVFTV